MAEPPSNRTRLDPPTIEGEYSVASEGQKKGPAFAPPPPDVPEVNVNVTLPDGTRVRGDTSVDEAGRSISREAIGLPSNDNTMVYLNAAVGVGVAAYVGAAILNGNGSKLVTALSEEAEFITIVAAIIGLGLVDRFSPPVIKRLTNAVRVAAIITVFARIAGNGSLRRGLESIGRTFDFRSAN
jgi:F0F1-type ATP synthase membrane subunit c/vacuolar-type H+-ATPase subunit K